MNYQIRNDWESMFVNLRLRLGWKKEYVLDSWELIFFCLSLLDEYLTWLLWTIELLESLITEVLIYEIENNIEPIIHSGKYQENRINISWLNVDSIDAFWTTRILSTLLFLVIDQWDISTTW